MYTLKCSNYNEIQMHLTPQESRTAFRVNASQIKKDIENDRSIIRCDIVEISEAGRQKAITASAESCPAESQPLPCGYIYLRRFARVYNLLE